MQYMCVCVHYQSFVYCVHHVYTVYTTTTHCLALAFLLPHPHTGIHLLGNLVCDVVDMGTTLVRTNRVDKAHLDTWVSHVCVGVYV